MLGFFKAMFEILKLQWYVTEIQVLFGLVAVRCSFKTSRIYYKNSIQFIKIL